MGTPKSLTQVLTHYENPAWTDRDRQAVKDLLHNTGCQSFELSDGGNYFICRQPAGESMVYIHHGQIEVREPWDQDPSVVHLERAKRKSPRNWPVLNLAAKRDRDPSNAARPADGPQCPKCHLPALHDGCQEDFADCPMLLAD